MREVFALGGLGGRFVEISGNSELSSYALAQGMGDGCTFLHRYAADRNERAYIRSAHPRVLAAVLGHVNEFGGLLDQPKRGLADDFRRPHERDDGSVGGFTGVDVQQTDSINGFYNTGYRFNHGRIAPFGNVGHAFD